MFSPVGHFNVFPTSSAELSVCTGASVSLSGVHAQDDPPNKTLGRRCRPDVCIFTFGLCHSRNELENTFAFIRIICTFSAGFSILLFVHIQ